MTLSTWRIALLGLAQICCWVSGAGAGVQEDLVSACRAGDLAKTRALLARGANADGPDGEGHVPLLFSVYARNPDLVALLLQHGANPNREGFCPQPECPGNHPALPLAASLDQPRIVSQLLSAKAEIGWHDHWATRDANARGFTDVFTVLKQAGGHEWASPPEGTRPALAPAMPPATPEPGELLPAPPLQPARAAGAPPRLAIVTEEPLRALGDLLEAQLSSAGWQLVERDELNRVLQEQHLTGGPVPAARGPALGALLGAEAVVLLDLAGTGAQHAADLRLVRVSPGLVLSRVIEPVPIRNSQAWLEHAVAAIQQGLAKARTAHGIAISTASLRPLSDLPKAVAFAREVESMLQNELLRQPGLAMLERKALEEVARERALGTPGEFWAGSYLADGTAELPLTGQGTATVSLRLQPMEKKPPLSFQAHGPESAAPALVREVVRQAVRALALEPAAPGDPLAEAARQLAQAKDTFESRLYVPAYRAIEAAALLGLSTPEARDWRLKIGVAAVGSTLADLIKENNFSTMIRAGWGEDWVNAKLGGRPWLRPAESLEVARRNLEQWHALLREAMESGDHAAAERWLEYGQKFVIDTSLAVWGSHRTAAGLLSYPEAVAAVPRTLREVLEDLLDLARGAPEWDGVTEKLQPVLLNRLKLFFSSTEDLTAEILRLLAVNSGEADLRARVRVLRLVLAMSEEDVSTFVAEYHSERYAALSYSIPTQYAVAVPGRVAAALQKSLRPEDRLYCQFIRCLTVKAAEKAAASDQLFKMIWEARDLFVKEPEALWLVRSIQLELQQYVNFPHWVKVSAPQGGTVQTPEMLDLRRKLYLLVMRANPQDPAPARVFFDAGYHPPGEDAAELQKFASMSSASTSKRGGAPAVAAGAARHSERPAVPSFAGAEPLRLPIAWTVGKQMPGMPGDFALDLDSLAVESDRLWAYGQCQLENSPAQSCLVEIALPSFATHAWPLPEGAVTTGSTARLIVEPGRISMTKDMEFYGEWNRQTHAWTFFRDLRPSSEPVRDGDKIYFFTGHPGETGLVQLDSKTGKAALLASQRRVPAATPLDDPHVIPRGLRLVAGRLIVYLSESWEPRKAPPTAAVTAHPSRWAVMLDVARGTWTELSAAPLPRAGAPAAPSPHGPAYAYLPAEQPGAVFARRFGNGAVALQLPLAEVPLAILPFAAEAIPRQGDSPRPSEPRLTDWLWTPGGYVTGDDWFGTRALWYLPTAALRQYVNDHKSQAEEKEGPLGAPMRPIAPH